MVDINKPDLEEGALYVFKKGVLQEIEVDPDDTMRKIKVTDSAFKGVVEVQKKMRSAMNGFKPDVSTVCSALLKEAATSPYVVEIVKRFCLEIYELIDSEDNV
jgi:hypothetical protein